MRTDLLTLSQWLDQGHVKLGTVGGPTMPGKTWSLFLVQGKAMTDSSPRGEQGQDGQGHPWVPKGLLFHSSLAQAQVRPNLTTT